MPDLENAHNAWVEVKAKDVERFIKHLLASKAAGKIIRFVVSVDTGNRGSNVYGDVYFPGDEVDPGLIVNNGVTANEAGNSPRIAVRNSQMTTDEIAGKNALTAAANKFVPRRK